MSKKNYTNEFKFKVAIEMIKGDLTMAEIISKYQVPRSVINRWKRQLLDTGSSIFKKSSNNELISNDKKLNGLHQIIGRLKVENDFLQQASAKLL